MVTQRSAIQPRARLMTRTARHEAGWRTMKTAFVCIFLTSLPLAAAPCFADTPATAADWAKGAQLYSGTGDFHRKITTASPAAQSYFDQGMRFLWAFNHDEATRSFAKAAQLDSNCAMCWWGVALTLGPNYNMP